MQAAVEQIAAMAQQLHDQHPDDDDGGNNNDSNNNGDGNGRKRKADDGQTQQQRARRNRYVSIACNQCKRRKIKCNGETPCQRCGNLNLECVYAPNCCNGFKDSQEYKDMSQHISMLQEQVNALWDNLNAMRSQMGNEQAIAQQLQHPHQNQHQQHTPIDPSLQSSTYHPPTHRGSGSFPEMQPTPGPSSMGISPNVARRQSRSQNEQPSFRGPTSSAFGFGVAKNSLETMGITSQGEGNINGGTETGMITTEVTPEPPETTVQPVPPLVTDKDPIWGISKDEALRLCRVYEDEMGLMYPVIDVDKVVAHAKSLYRFIEAVYRTGLMRPNLPGDDVIDDEDTNILKLMLATALTVEAYGRSELGQRLFEYVQPAIDNLLLRNAGIKGVRLLTMAAMYEFQRDNEGTSWRMIGLTARLCIELGLHRKETYDAMKDEAERTDTMLLFWAIYVLDRRWSFGTGMPFALQESDIDPQLPKPEERSPYLSAMITYSTISSKVWRSISAPTSTSPTPINTEEMNYFDYQVIQWHRNVPAHLRFEHPSQNGTVTTPSGAPTSRAARRLRILLYLRANQMRIHIYRPVLHSATSIMAHREQAQTVVDVAKDSVRVLTHINQTSDLYRTQQVLFNAFLTSALAVLFLAVSHTPALFAENVREEFYMSLELVRGFSKGSWVSKRLWKTIRVLKEVGPKLGLIMKESAAATAQNNPSNEELDPSRSAAVAMAGLAGHNVDELSLFNGAPHQHNQWHAAAGASSSPENMVHDLTSLFEAAGGYAALDSMSGHDGNYLADGMENFTGDEGLSNILKELF